MKYIQQMTSNNGCQA